MESCTKCKYYIELDELDPQYGRDCARKVKVFRCVSLYSGAVYVEFMGKMEYASEERASVLPWRCGRKARHLNQKGV